MKPYGTLLQHPGPPLWWSRWTEYPTSQECSWGSLKGDHLANNGQGMSDLELLSGHVCGDYKMRVTMMATRATIGIGLL